MHTSLPIKYRPASFEDIVGQEMPVKYLSSLIRKGQIGKNLIFYGPFGSGKTSSCRIFAKALNCQNPTSSGSPCNTCENCLQPLALELDAASAGGKEDIKELLELAKTPPLYGKYRVIILDECQNLSRAAWDSLLKSIEEPKDFQVWIFSTTELEKIRPAIKSRCQVLEIKTLSPEACKKHLKEVCLQEKFSYEEIALDIISFMSRGHARDLLKNLEQISYLGDITVENAKVIFNLGYLQPLVELVLASCNPQTKSFLSILHSFSESPKRISELLKQFLLFFYYKFEQSLEMDINPSFALIPEADKRMVWGKLKGSSIGIQSILSSINSLKDSSYLSLEISLLELHSKMHKKETLVVEAGVAGGSVPSTKKKQGRQFITLANAPERIDTIIEAPTPEVPKAMTAGVLIENGFISVPLKNESDLIILGD